MKYGKFLFSKVEVFKLNKSMLIYQSTFAISLSITTFWDLLFMAFQFIFCLNNAKATVRKWRVFGFIGLRTFTFDFLYLSKKVVSYIFLYLCVLLALKLIKDICSEFILLIITCLSSIKINQFGNIFF